MEHKRCADCKFFKDKRIPLIDVQLGDCVRHAPVITQKKNSGEFPLMCGSEWCGEFEPTKSRERIAIEISVKSMDSESIIAAIDKFRDEITSIIR